MKQRQYRREEMAQANFSIPLRIKKKIANEASKKNVSSSKYVSYLLDRAFEKEIDPFEDVIPI